MIRLVDTPLRGLEVLPELRPGGLVEPLRDAILPTSGDTDLRARLEHPDLLCVTTGQQPGLFTGPLYTVYKALSAAALAHWLEREWERPVLPLFWLAGDDHDFAEASHAAFPGADGTVASITLPPRDTDAPLTPMYRELLGDEITGALARLESEMPGAEFKPEVMAWLHRHYRPGATVAGAFGQALAELLAPYGILCLDSTHSAVKRAAAPWLLQALARSQELDRVLATRAAELSQAGQEPGVTVGDGATLVMLESGQGRDRLLREDGHFVTRRSRETWTLEQLEGIASREPARLSPNVLLRPVVESALLPTVAYIGGPGELRYLALTPPIYHQLSVPRQTPVPRWSGVLVEPRVERVLDKFGASLEELMAGPGQLESRVIRDQLPAGALETLAGLRAALQEHYGRLETIALEIDPTLRDPVRKTAQHAQSESEALEKRFVQHLKRRQETELQQIERARNAVQPLGKPQERVFGVPPLLARYGPGILDTVHEHIQQWYRTTLEARFTRV